MSRSDNDRFAALLCFLLGALALAAAVFGVVDFTRGCAAFPHGCVYLALLSPVLLGVVLVAGGAGWWLWTGSTHHAPGDSR